MQKKIRRTIRHQGDGINVIADVAADVSINSGRSGETNVTRSRSVNRIVQRGRRQSSKEVPDAGPEPDS